MEINKVYLGDCIDVMATFPNECIDLTVTSPPYDNLRTYNATCEWNFDVFKQVAEQLYRITKMGGGTCLDCVRRYVRRKRNRHIVQTSVVL